MKDYGRKSTFASFLPGIAGIKGIPMWCYYVNRGQAVTSFGVENKDRSIMEFAPAHVAYQNTKRTGFRTFVLCNGKFVEPFSDETLPHNMDIEQNLLTISEENADAGLKTTVSYYILPEERIGALVREVTITNTADKDASIEILDGMPALIPYGISQDNLKNMTQTAKAWMQVEKTEGGNAFYRVRASIEDSTTVKVINGGNFAVAFMGDGEKLYPQTDPETIFAYDDSLANPVVFKNGGIDAVEAKRQNVSNIFPSAFFKIKKTLKKGESVSVYEMYGHAASMNVLDTFMADGRDISYFMNKKLRARELVEELCRVIDTKTGDSKFDGYVKYTYMDNVLRGGAPIRLGNNKIFYVYSRKHGDIERDYNYFSMLPEFYSEGNGSYRDINQNRRCDTFFAPFVGPENIHLFYSLIQLDGYNPLGIEKLTYRLTEDKAGIVTAELDAETSDKIKALVTKPFTPGSLYMLLQDLMDEEAVKVLFDSIIDFSEVTVNGNFQEGYWCDHWTYNLDLVEDYLEVFPDKEKELLYENAYTYFKSQANVLPRSKRYEITDNGLRQYKTIRHGEASSEDKLVRGNYGKGEVVYSTLMEKLILLSAVKFATLDAYGMGIEMEGGKPGWYDALNGMPALLGSSMGEAYELARMLDYTIGALTRYPGKISLLNEVGAFVNDIYKATTANSNAFARWDANNTIKEAYREAQFDKGISGDKTEFDSAELVKILKCFLSTVMVGIERALKYGEGVCPMYFTYTVKPASNDATVLCESDFNVDIVPDFLEGQVRYFKLPESKERKIALYENVKKSDLYDKKLKMYKVNASLMEASYELGRARAFTPGWLENESIWLHMEYKYLLELIRSGLYKEYFEDFKNACVPFLDEDMYGRSTLENSSFLASSANPNPDIHGKGFVARLSGSTIEFISMWKLMMFGKNSFYTEDGELKCKFTPAVPKYLIGADRKVTATFLGKTVVEYNFAEAKDYIPGEYAITGMDAVYESGVRVSVTTDTFAGQTVRDLREGKIKKIEVTVK